eukprot:366440-Chlamydomonas_euryale.AAC.1
MHACATTPWRRSVPLLPPLLVALSQSAGPAPRPGARPGGYQLPRPHPPPSPCRRLPVQRPGQVLGLVGTNCLAPTLPPLPCRRLPVPRPGQVLGLVGTNGIGKSTALKVLAGKLKPNLGRFEDLPDWQEILAYFRGSELQNYFTKVLEDNLKPVIKPQYVDHIPKAVRGNVRSVLAERDAKGKMEQLMEELELIQ